MVANMLGGDGTKVIGSALKNNLFGAAYEYTKSDGTTEVMIFQRLGRVSESENESESESESESYNKILCFN